MKKLTYLAAFILIAGIAIAAEAEQKDQYGNVVYTKEGHRVNYIKSQTGYVRTELDENHNVIFEEYDNVIFKEVSPKDTQKSFTVAEDIIYPTTIPTLNQQSIQQSIEYLQLEKRIATFGSGIGASNIVVNDINNDEKPEIICGGNASHGFGGDNFWYILSYSPAENNYFQTWVSDYYSTTITKILLDDIDDNGSDEIIIALVNGDIEIYDAQELIKINTVETIAGTVKNFTIGDIDIDGEKEFILADQDNVYVYSATDYNLEWSGPYGSGFLFEIEIGNVDDDQALEIVISRTDPNANGFVIDGVTHDVEWEYDIGTGFGRVVELYDIDDDGRQEIIASDGWEEVRAYDVDLQAIKWELYVDYGEINDVELIDTNGDGFPELLVGDGQWGYVRLYDLVNLIELSKIKNPEHGVTDIKFCDVDNDGEGEVLWGAGHSSTGDDYLYVGNFDSKLIEWQSVDESGPYNAFDIDDVDNDGKNEIVLCSFESEAGYDDGIISIYDAQSKSLEWQGEPIGELCWTGIHDLEVADIDDDNVKEIVIATDRLYDGLLLVYNGITHELEWKTPNPRDYFGMPFSTIDIYDVDGDDVKEIIAGNMQAHTGAEGVFVFAFDALTGAEKWRTIDLASRNCRDVKISDLDNDGQIEIIALTDGTSNNIHVINGIDGSIIWEDSDYTCTSLDVADFNDDGIKDMIVGTNDGRMVVYNGEDYSTIYNEILIGNSIEGIKVTNTGNDKKIVLTANNHAYIYDLQEGALIWSSPDISSSLYKIMCLDIENDDKTEFLFGSLYALHIYQKTNKKPEAFIDSITPNPATEGELVTLQGHGEDPDGNIVGYSWRSSIDGDLGNEATLSVSTLSIGEHAIVFKVKDNDDAWSDEVSRTLTVLIPIPTAPTELIASAISSSQIELTWQDNSSNEDGFKIERSLDGSSFSQVATVGTNVTTYNDIGLTSGTTYYYRASAYNTTGDSEYSNISEAATHFNIYIRGMYPSRNMPDKRICIIGRNFGKWDPSSSRVYFEGEGGNADAHVIRWHNYYIICKVPQLFPGVYTVRVINSSGQSNPKDFKILAPRRPKIK